MQNVRIETSQNVVIDYEVGSIGDRVLALLIDWLIFLGYGLFVLIISQIAGGLPEFMYVVFYLPVFFYPLLCEVTMDGQTIGKQQMKLKVIKLDGSQPNLGAYLLRWIIKPIDFFPGIFGGVGLITYILNGKGQRVGDLAAGTAVIKLKPRVNLSYHREVASLDESYEPVFKEVMELQDRDIAMIKEALQVYKNSANLKPLSIIYNKTKSLLGVESDLPPVKFLYTVVKDYSHLTSKL